jgi:hydrogenase nickel incorporation protein HypB
LKPRILEVRQNILKKNDEIARGLRARFDEHGVFVVNVVSSPGAGKTELLAAVMQELARTGLRLAAVVGDLATENDAQRLAASGAPARQILTGTMCHLEADMVETAIVDFDLADLDLLFIENVGNLVCPQSWDLGEDLRVLLFPCTEGEDKPLKYPTLINTCDLVLFSKMDLAGAVGFDLDLARGNCQTVRPGIPMAETSARSGRGLQDLVRLLEDRARDKARPVDEPCRI